LEERREVIAKMHRGFYCDQRQTCPAAEAATHRNKKGVTLRRLTKVYPLLPPGTTLRRTPAESLEVNREVAQSDRASSSIHKSVISSLFT
jgi:hypothetical protein